jgi:hypothetical protein
MAASEALAGVVAGVVTFFVTLHVTTPESRAIVELPASTASTADEHSSVGALQSPGARARRFDPPFFVPFRQVPETDIGADDDEPPSFDVLRNRILDETGRAMQRRGVSVMDCLAGVDLASAQKIRFAVHVRATPTEAIVGSWRFVEIADGQALPDAFPECAAAALGTVGLIVSDTDSQFPRYDGDIFAIYRIEAPGGG